jgi:serine protease AprX
MAKPSEPANIDRLFIKVILPQQGKEGRVPGGGDKAKPFRDVTRQRRQQLQTQIDATSRAIAPVTKRLGHAPVRLKLMSKASAKSHRPQILFSDRTCPIIGAGKLGELFLKATPEGLNTIEELVADEKAGVGLAETTAAQLLKEISSIDAIEPVTPEYRRGGLSSKDLLRMSPKVDGRFATRAHLFDYGDGDQESLVSDFLARCSDAGIVVRHGGYSERSGYYETLCKTTTDIETLSEIVGVRSLRRMPIMRSIRHAGLNRRPVPKGLPAPTGALHDYPVVAVVDSGIASIPELQRWVIDRESTVPEIYRNPEHGSFVAGLIALGNNLNPDIPSIDSSPCAILDLQVVPNDDPAKGDVDELTESQLLQDLESALRRHANEVKVWNLSLSSDAVCSLDEFSPLAVELDRLQETYNVSFVISAGNYDSLPLLGYPRLNDELTLGRITSPADSVLGITVGSIAHVDHPVRGPAKGEPSPFSRHGAGPNYVIKPDLVHMGGTVGVDGRNQLGVASFDGIGVSESIGTSFSTPLVSRALANVYHAVTPTPSPVLARAILTHHARDPRHGGRVADAEENYFGFGLPVAVPACVECTPWTSTLVFEDTLRPGYYLEWDDFPYPDSLRRDGRFFGDIWMTVAFSPARGQRWGTEYCETHIDAHFGVYRTKVKPDPGERPRFVGLVPPEHKNPGLLYESYQVEKLRKWAPVRTYFGSLGEKGERGEKWRMKVQLLTRHGVEKDAMKSQPFALILTIADPTRKAPVYDEMVRKIRTRFQSQNLTLRPTTRVQLQG